MVCLSCTTGEPKVSDSEPGSPSNVKPNVASENSNHAGRKEIEKQIEKAKKENEELQKRINTAKGEHKELQKRLEKTGKEIEKTKKRLDKVR